MSTSTVIKGSRAALASNALLLDRGLEPTPKSEASLEPEVQSARHPNLERYLEVVRRFLIAASIISGLLVLNPLTLPMAYVFVMIFIPIFTAYLAVDALHRWVAGRP